MAYMKNAQASLKSLAENGVINIAGAGAPTGGTSGTGVNICGPASIYFDKTNAQLYINTNTVLSPTWTLIPNGAASSVTNAMLAGSITADKFISSTFQQATQTLTAAQIVSAAVGGFAHASGVVLVAPQGAHVVVELISVIMHYDFLNAAFTAGGNITVNNAAGGAALTGLVSAANSVGAGVDKSVMFVPLATAGIALVENGGLNLVTSVAFTQPGTAAGSIRLVTNYRLHSTGF